MNSKVYNTKFLEFYNYTKYKLCENILRKYILKY